MANCQVRIESICKNSLSHRVTNKEEESERDKGVNLRVSV